ncbi:MAG TPA: fasciclin domain-containing protein [Prolixibacteraceae bacterium]|nr:fasciclin domain-containing protein [Prolixibacteraceae bacterium]
MNVRIKNTILLIAVILLGASSCTKEWEEHYDNYPETVNQHLWEAMQNVPEISNFVAFLKEKQADTLFNDDVIYTILAPTNDALSQFLDTATITDTSLLVNYHFLTHFIQSGNVEGKRKIQTLTEKFALFERYGSDMRVDEIEVQSESPLYLDGKFFILDKVARPLPNFYQYYKLNNPVLRSFIDSQDSIVLDRERSKPIGFDDQGRTVYDSVTTIFNKFEAEYFEVSEEFRNKSATIVFPIKDDYENALTVMAQNLGSGYTSYEDIPIDWQHDILMPHLLEQGVFANMLEPEEFMWKAPNDTARLLNILGDSIDIFYTPVDKTLLSNGYTYNYQDFTIPDSLYLGGSVFEAEDLVEAAGVGKWSWRESVTVASDDNTIRPFQEYIPRASNDSILRVVFPKGYQGKYNLKFQTQNLFPRKYVMVIQTHMDFGGLYDIYVNGELMKSYYSDINYPDHTFDYYEFVARRGLINSVTGTRYVAERGERYNKFDMYVDNITEYSRANITIEYKGPGRGAPSNGLVIDYIEFIPVVE